MSDNKFRKGEWVTCEECGRKGTIRRLHDEYKQVGYTTSYDIDKKQIAMYSFVKKDIVFCGGCFKQNLNKSFEYIKRWAY